MRFTPTSSKYANEECGGVFMIVTDRAAIRPVRVGVEIAAMLNKLYGAKYELEAADKLFGSKEGLAQIRAGADPLDIVNTWAAGEAKWRALRAKYSDLSVACPRTNELTNRPSSESCEHLRQ